MIYCYGYAWFVNVSNLSLGGSIAHSVFGDHPNIETDNFSVPLTGELLGGAGVMSEDQLSTLRNLDCTAATVQYFVWMLDTGQLVNQLCGSPPNLGQPWNWSASLAQLGASIIAESE